MRFSACFLSTRDILPLRSANLSMTRLRAALVPQAAASSRKQPQACRTHLFRFVTCKDASLLRCRRLIPNQTPRYFVKIVPLKFTEVHCPCEFRHVGDGCLRIFVFHVSHRWEPRLLMLLNGDWLSGSLFKYTRNARV